MGIQFYADGCIKPNVPLARFVVTFAPNCEHSKCQHAQLVITATDRESALNYARKWINLPGLTVAGVFSVRERRRERKRSASRKGSPL